MENSVKERLIAFINYKGLKMKDFERMCGLSSGYVTSMRKSLGVEKLNNVLIAFPELSREWLLYGEGEMLKAHINQHANGDNNTQVAGYGNSVNFSSALDKALDEIAEQRKLLAEQIQINKEQNEKIIDLINKIQK